MASHSTARSAGLSAALAAIWIGAACGEATAPPRASNAEDAAPPAGALDAGTAEMSDTHDAGHEARWMIRYVAPEGVPGDGSAAHPWIGFAEAVAAAEGPTELVLLPGTYSATASVQKDVLCGNCSNPNEQPAFSAGFVIDRKTLRIRAQQAGTVTLRTNAGYGIYIHGGDVALRALSITGGRRDADARATSAAIVARDAKVRIEGVRIHDNDELGPVDRYPGIAGVVAREGADIVLLDSTIEDNSWDGFVVMRGARGMAFRNTIRRGNGVGIASTWNSRMIAIQNQVSRYWKGIGAFGESRMYASNNLVRDNLAWGLSASTRSSLWAEFHHNTVVANRECGAIFGSLASIRASHNIFAQNGRRTTRQVCPPSGIWLPLRAVHADLAFPHNLVFQDGPADVWHTPVAEPGRSIRPDDPGRDVSSAFFQRHDVLHENPGFAGGPDYALAPDAPARGAGARPANDPDAPRRDLGHTGGPNALRQGIEGLDWSDF